MKLLLKTKDYDQNSKMYYDMFSHSSQKTWLKFDSREYTI